MSLLPIETPNPLFGKYLYPAAKELMEQQQDIAWFAQEIKVENDIQDYLQNMSREAYGLVNVTLTGFVEVEQDVGDVWDVIGTWFPHSEIEGACKQMAAMEKSVHAFFYQKMSDTLNINPEDTAQMQQDIKAIKDKLTFIKSITKNLSKNKPLSLATVALLEQVLLFSNFAMLKSFKANGNNLIVNTLTGVDYVVNDEVIHGVFASYLHNTYLAEYQEVFGDFDIEKHTKDIVKLTESVVAHEDAVINYAFPADLPINDITASQLKMFIRSRANMVLKDLGLEPIYDVTDNPIASWFYKGANAIKLHDFFSSGSNQYSRVWSLTAFSRKKYLGDKK
jgi:ribonucleotide reductase beta subunit family protein with ferritin-like domain